MARNTSRTELIKDRMDEKIEQNDSACDRVNDEGSTMKEEQQ